jgi:hypothetical protein
MSINTNILVARPLFSRKMVACFCLLSLILLPTHKVFSAGTMEYYHYDSHGSLLDVYQTGSNHQLSQRWNAWGERKVLHPSSLQGSFLPSKNIPVYLGYKGAKSVADDSLVLLGGSKVYAPRLHRLVNPTGATEGSRSRSLQANNDPLNQEYNGPEVKKAGPGWRNAAYALEMAAAVVITAGICVSDALLCGGTVDTFNVFAAGGFFGESVGGITLAATTNIYGLSLLGVGGVGGITSCPIAFRHRSNTAARGWCKGSLSAIHTGARIALSYAFRSGPGREGLGSGALKWGRLTSNQVAYGASFTAINGTSSIASMALGNSWTSMSTGHRVGASILAYGIGAAQAIEDMFVIRWMEEFGAFQREGAADLGDIEFVSLGQPRTFSRSNTLETIPEISPRKWASRIGRVVVATYGIDLASAANKRQKWLTGKEVGCQMLDTTIYQGIKVGVENAQGGAKWGRVPAAAVSGWFGHTGCGGDYDSFF